AEESAAEVPPPPPQVEGVPDPIPPPPEDGLHRFVVWPPVPVVDPADPADTGGASTPPTSTPPTSAASGPDQATTALAPPRDPAWTLDQTLVDRIDEDTVVVFEDGVPGFYDGDVFVPLIGNSTASSGTPSAVSSTASEEPMTEDDAIDDLLDIEGVVSAVAVGDGSIAVVAEEPGVLDGRGLNPVVDTPFALAADPYEYYQWTLDNTGQNLDSLSNPPTQTPDADIDGLEAMAGARGEGVVVAVIDTGVDFSHPDLAGQSWVNADEVCANLIDDDGNGFVDDCNGWDFGNEDNQPYAPGQQEHGTHVAGTIAAIADNGVGVVGMAPDVTIMDLNVQGAGGMTMSGISRAVRYAADNGADIINMSLGTQPGTPAAAVGSLIEAVRYAESKGTLVVVAAGNSSVNLDSAPVYPANIEGSNMITVGASAPDESKAGFSNSGSPVDVFAPGVLIVSTVPGDGYKFMNGTSMASPTVAGAAAALLSSNPDLDPLGVREQLVGTGDVADAYQGLAANPVRINQAWALGIDGDPAVAQVAISGLTDATADEVVASITMSDPGGEYPEPYRWEASLVAISGGQAYGLVDHPLTVDWQNDQTDERGAVALAMGGQPEARLATQLPPGSYGLVIEAVPEDDPTMRLGDAFVSTFVVPEVPTPEPDPGEGTTTTTTPGVTTIPGETTPTTAPDNGSGPTTTAPSSSTTAPDGSGPTTTQWSTTTWAWPPTTGPSTTTPGSSPSTTAPSTTVSPTTPPTTAAPAPTSPPTTNPSPSTTTSIPATSAPATTSPATTSPPTTSPATTASPTTSPVTTSPATTSPATTSPTPTTQPATTSPTTTGTTSPPTTTVEGGFALYRISPTAGFVNQQTMVSIDGTFPSAVNVWFGDQPGQLVHHSSTWIIVVAPPRSQAGPVDVTLRTNGAGTVLLAQDAFTYIDPSGGSTPTVPDSPDTTTPSPTTVPTTGPTPSTTSPGGGGEPTTPTTSPGGGDGPTTTTGDGGATTSSTVSTSVPDGGDVTTTTTPGATSTTDGSGGGATTTTPGATSTTTGDETSTTTEPPGPPLRTRAQPVGQPISLAGGLQGVPLQGLSDLAQLSPCISEPCRARRI
ncbi:MAG: S8 family serine peptidase, partial [Actinomycetota bacterium]